MKLRNECSIEGYIVKGSLKAATSKTGRKYGQFDLSYPAGEDWQRYRVFCDHAAAEALIKKGFGKTDTGRQRLLVQGEMSNTLFTDKDGNKKSSFAIKNARISICIAERDAKKPSESSEKSFAAAKSDVLEAPKSDDEIFAGEEA